MSTPTWFLPVLIGLNCIALPYFLLILVTTVAAFCKSSRAVRSSDSQTRFLVAIPAHDEEHGIAETVRSCRSVDYPSHLFQVLVLADNCSDGTAAIARREGATVLERRDLTRKSKGHAIDYMIERLRASGTLDSFDAIVIVDADSTVSRDLLHGFAGEVQMGHDWVQCIYTVSNPHASWRTRLMTYAFSLFNGVTPMGQSALGLSAGYRGNGMCLTIRGLQRVPWTTHGLVEDLEYSWTVRVAGGKIAFLPTVLVQGVMLGEGGSAAASQRQRWEFGRGELRNRFLLPLFRSPHLNILEKLTSLLELSMPPMVRLLAVYSSLVVTNLTCLFVAHPGGAAAWALAATSLIMSLAILLHAMSPFVIFQLSWRYLLILPYLPFYSVWKLAVALRGRPTHWVRTQRERPVKPGACARTGE